jgi:hypothetical protein
MTQLTSYITIFSKWPSLEAFGSDIGIDGAHARTLKMRDALPPRYWKRVECAAKKRGIAGVNLETLAQIAEMKEAVT